MSKRKGKKRKLSAYGDPVKYSPNSFIDRERKPAKAGTADATTERTLTADLLQAERERAAREALLSDESRQERTNRFRSVFNSPAIQQTICHYLNNKRHRRDYAEEARRELERVLGFVPARDIEDDIGHVSNSLDKAAVKADVIADHRKELDQRMKDAEQLDVDRDGVVETEEMTPAMRVLAKYM